MKWSFKICVLYQIWLVRRMEWGVRKIHTKF